MNGNLCINLNVGGSRFSTSLSTLRRFPDSMLGAMFSGNHTTPQMSDGSYFIDRDGTHFRHILNFLRDPEEPVVELSPREKEELKREARYYCLENEMFSVSDEVMQMRTTGGFEILVTQDNEGVLYQKSDSVLRPEITAKLTVCRACKFFSCYDAFNECEGLIPYDKMRISSLQPNTTLCTLCTSLVPSPVIDLEKMNKEGGLIAFDYSKYRKVQQPVDRNRLQISVAKVLRSSLSNNETVRLQLVMEPFDDDDVINTTYECLDPDQCQFRIHSRSILATGIVLHKVIVDVTTENEGGMEITEIDQIRYILSPQSQAKIESTEMYIDF